MSTRLSSAAREAAWSREASRHEPVGLDVATVDRSEGSVHATADARGADVSAAIATGADAPHGHLRPLFGFYGGKWRDSLKHYPAPLHGTIGEPFARVRWILCPLCKPPRNSVRNRPDHCWGLAVLDPRQTSRDPVGLSRSAAGASECVWKTHAIRPLDAEPVHQVR
jgi:hypothetical protein